MIVACIMILGTVFLIFNEKKSGDVGIGESFSEENIDEETSEGEPSASATPVYIHVYGEVKKPGVYTFAWEPRVCDVIEKAGGFTKKADQTSLNLAMSVSDGTQVVVEKKGKDKQSSKEESAEDDKRVNLNSATKEELMTIPGIGESKATQIISYREEQGRFQKPEDIMNISGIKEGVFNRIKDYIRV